MRESEPGVTQLQVANRRDCWNCRKAFAPATTDPDDCFCSPRCSAACLGPDSMPRDALVKQQKPPMVKYADQRRLGLRVTGRARSSSRKFDTVRITNLQVKKAAQREAREEARVLAQQGAWFPGHKGRLRKLKLDPAVLLPPVGTVAPPEVTERRFRYPEPIGPKPYFDYRMVVRKESK